MGLGKAAAGNMAKSGGVITVILLTGFRVSDYFLTDQATLSQLVGSLATDIVKVGITVGASLATMAAITGTAAVTLAIGPLAVVLLVGVATSMALTLIDDKLGLTEKLIATLDDIGTDVMTRSQTAVEQFVGDTVDYILERAQRVAINFAHHRLKQLIPLGPRVSR